jgi:DNA (cytosine-5)-methyltransferase 1
MMRVLDLFSGIGGFSLGLERAGMRTVAFCEINPFCRRVLRKHWPEVPIYDDIRQLTARRLAADGIAADVLCGGFPCQDISNAGRGAGMDGERSGLWAEYARLLGELRPRYVIVENVAALLGRGLGRVLGDLAALGFDAEWHCIPASAVGAPHRRDRIWIVAYDASRGEQDEPHRSSHPEGQPVGAVDRASDRIESGHSAERSEHHRGSAPVLAPPVADALGAGLEGRARLAGYLAIQLAASQRGGALPDADEQHRRPGESQGSGRRLAYGSEAGDGSWWFSEPDVGRVANGVPSRVDRLRAIGNAVVPQIPELIGRAILAVEEERQHA